MTKSSVRELYIFACTIHCTMQSRGMHLSTRPSATSATARPHAVTRDTGRVVSINIAAPKIDLPRPRMSVDIPLPLSRPPEIQTGPHSDDR